MAGNVIRGAGYTRALHGGRVRLLSPTVEEEASAGEVIGEAGDAQAQPDGLAPLLTPTADLVASVGNVNCGAGDGHGWCGPTSLRRCANSGPSSALTRLFWAVSPAIFQWRLISIASLLRSPSLLPLRVRLVWRPLQILLDAPEFLCAPRPRIKTARPESPGNPCASSPRCRATTVTTISLLLSPLSFLWGWGRVRIKNELKATATLLQLRL